MKKYICDSCSSDVNQHDTFCRNCGNQFLFDSTEVLPKGIKELRDGLTVERLKSDYPWVLKAKIKDAVIGQYPNGSIIWYEGTWFDGEWKEGYWKGGTWKKGIWEGGVVIS